MDVVISGSSGLIGSALRRALRERGDHPVRLVRPDTTAREGDLVRWDIEEGRIESGALEGVDAVVHLAGEPMLGRWTEAKRRRIRRTRVRSTRLLAEALNGLQRPPAVMLSASGVNFYGASRGDELLTERSSPGNGFLASVCAEWERAARPAADAGIRLVHLRTAVVQHPEADMLKLQLLPFKLGLGAKLSSGRQWFPWIHLEDHVRAMLHLMGDEQANGPVNLAAPGTVRQGEYARTLGRVLNRPVFLTVPQPAVALVFGRAAAEELATVDLRVVPQRLDELGFAFHHPELEPALRDLLDRPAA